MVAKVIEFGLGIVVGVFLAHLFVVLFLAPDEVQEKVARKAQCQTYEEYLSIHQSPEEKLKFVERHKNSIAECER